MFLYMYTCIRLVPPGRMRGDDKRRCLDFGELLVLLSVLVVTLEPEAVLGLTTGAGDGGDVKLKA